MQHRDPQLVIQWDAGELRDALDAGGAVLQQVLVEHPQHGWAVPLLVEGQVVAPDAATGGCYSARNIQLTPLQQARTAHAAKGLLCVCAAYHRNH